MSTSGVQRERHTKVLHHHDCIYQHQFIKTRPGSLGASERIRTRDALCFCLPCVYTILSSQPRRLVPCICHALFRRCSLPASQTASPLEASVASLPGSPCHTNATTHVRCLRYSRDQTLSCVGVKLPHRSLLHRDMLAHRFLMSLMTSTQSLTTSSRLLCGRDRGTSSGTSIMDRLSNGASQSSSSSSCAGKASSSSCAS